MTPDAEFGQIGERRATCFVADLAHGGKPPYDFA